MTSHFKTPFIKVGHGGLQGDCLSPLTFKMCFNTFIQYRKSQNFQQLGFKFKANLDNVVSLYLRRWLEIRINGTSDICLLSRTRFGLDLILPSTKLIQCQSVIRQRLKNSPNADIRAIYEDTSKGTNVQYDTFRSTRNVIKSIRKTKEDRVVQELKSQGLTLSFLLTDVLSSTIMLWSVAQSALPRNIFKFYHEVPE